jgi:hypothetical protein
MSGQATTSITVQRRLKKSSRHLWPLYGEFTVLFIVFGTFIARYKGK